jgi:hypothetical protein
MQTLDPGWRSATVDAGTPRVVQAPQQHAKVQQGLLTDYQTTSRVVRTAATAHIRRVLCAAVRATATPTSGTWLAIGPAAVAAASADPQAVSIVQCFQIFCRLEPA